MLLTCFRTITNASNAVLNRSSFASLSRATADLKIGGKSFSEFWEVWGLKLLPPALIPLRPALAGLRGAGN